MCGRFVRFTPQEQYAKLFRAHGMGNRTFPGSATAEEIVPILESTITCPHCDHQSTEHMPTNACQFFYKCKGCGEMLRPKRGDCCVFCSYGTVPCPPIQEAGK
jgi:hypothetical protein